jgi:Helix-turn-helix domain
LIAHKAINLSEELSGTDKRVAGALIDCFNRETGQCDPSLGTIAYRLNISRRTVIRSMSRLERAVLFRKSRHGGKSHRNSYEPLWPRFRELDAQWNARKKARSLSRRPKVSPLEGQTCHLAGDQAVTQTCLSNQSKETYRGKEQQAPSKTQGSKELPREAKEASSAARFIATRKSRTIGSADAAKASAERRWLTAVNDCFVSNPELYALVIEVVDSATKEAATEAELRRHGAGLDLILDRLPELGVAVGRDGESR